MSEDEKTPTYKMFKFTASISTTATTGVEAETEEEAREIASKRAIYDAETGDVGEDWVLAIGSVPTESVQLVKDGTDMPQVSTGL